MLGDIAFAISIICVGWLIGLTIFAMRLSAHYNHLFKETNKRTLQAIMESLLNDLQVAKKDIEMLTNKCDTIMKDGQFHIQKIGLLRFNPFKDTGGDQSFILSLIDGNDSGVVISGLYSRSGTRWYAKRIANGQGMEHELSAEEKQAVKDAKRITHEK